MCKNDKINFTLRLSKEMKRRIEILAEQKESYSSQVMREAIKIGLEHLEHRDVSP